MYLCGQQRHVVNTHAAMTYLSYTVRYDEYTNSNCSLLCSRNMGAAELSKCWTEIKKKYNNNMIRINFLLQIAICLLMIFTRKSHFTRNLIFFVQKHTTYSWALCSVHVILYVYNTIFDWMDLIEIQFWMCSISMLVYYGFDWLNKIFVDTEWKCGTVARVRFPQDIKYTFCCVIFFFGSHLHSRYSDLSIYFHVKHREKWEKQEYRVFIPRLQFDHQQNHK